VIFPYDHTMKTKTGLVVPISVLRQAGTITIAPVKVASYRPTKSELAAILKGEAAIARGEHVLLNRFSPWPGQ